LWIRLSTARRGSKQPLNRADQMLLKDVVRPHVVAMPQRRVKNLSLAPFVTPGNRHVVRLLQFRLFHVQAHQDTNGRRVEVFELVDFLLMCPAVCEWLHGGMIGVQNFDCDDALLVPWMAVKRAADQLWIDWMTCQRVGRAVNAEKSSAGFEPGIE